ncbi:MAG: hypothetical protein GC158_03035 [Cyanobacteria bacterium RI_101]|nr:hypothetical protein [Cyanobacteria bacterium RI_101]
MYADLGFNPPKSPLVRGTLKLIPPFQRGARGDLDTYVYTIEGKRTAPGSRRASPVFLYFS